MDKPIMPGEMLSLAKTPKRQAQVINMLPIASISTAHHLKSSNQLI